jgi:hypothetical protein
VTLALAVHEKGRPPVLATVNWVWAATHVVSWMLVGWISRVAGTGVAVGDGPGVGDGPTVGETRGVGVARGGPAVGVGAPPLAAVAVAAAPEIVCDDELEFEEEELLEDAEGARINWTPKCCTSSASSTATSTATRRKAPSVRALGSPLEPVLAEARCAGGQAVSPTGVAGASGGDSSPSGPSNGWVGASEIASRGSVIGVPHTGQRPLASAISSTDLAIRN